MDESDIKTETLYFEKEQIDADAVRVKLRGSVDPNQIIYELHGFFQSLINEHAVRIYFDMEGVEFPNGSFIAMLIGTTHEVRQFGGDLYLLNLTETARNHFATFTPLTYLLIGAEEEFKHSDSIESFMPAEPDLLELEEQKPVTIQVAAAVDSLQRITDFVTQAGQRVGLSHDDLSRLKIAVYECCMNVIEHGYRFEPNQMMALEIVQVEKQLEITILDWAKPFDFEKIKPYNVNESFEQKSRGGFGLYIIARAVDDMKYQADAKNGNRFTLIKKLK
ncbi:ATP-binding protein [candidate division KSB1 bacterium]|nr:ATP-binding protein [candidate division KSB1 bacterium]